jgi:hypothetical protein
MKVILLTLSIILCHAAANMMQAQTSPDSTIVEVTPKKEKKGSIFSGRPGKAMMMSLIIPGTGQIYNKSYLRVPFVWGAVIGAGLPLRYYTQQYRCFRDYYIHLIDGTTYVPPKHCDENLLVITDPSTVRVIRDEANKNMQTWILVFSAVWLANGIDAFVDAHLKEFDINEDLTLEFGTRFDDDPYAPMRVGVFVQF